MIDLRCFKTVTTLISGILLILNCHASLANSDNSKPNILLILVDDLGWRDVGAYGSDYYQTPNIDSIAAAGLKFNQAYTAAHICSPTRASLLTGKHPARLNITDWIPGWSYPHEKLAVPNWNTDGLPASEETIGEMLQQRGYSTAWIGKWHVRGLQAFSNQPLKGEDYKSHNGAQYHGFDYGHQDFSLNGKFSGADPKGVMALTKQTIEFITKAEQKKQPWFAAISHYSVHTPLHFTEREKQRYLQQDRVGLAQQNPEYAAMVASLDESVGTLLNHLTSNNLTHNTLILFYSDNGGLDKNDTGFPTNNAPLRNGKATLYEGGIRVPFIASWPGKIAAGSESNEMITSTDFYPTLAKLVGSKKLPNELDGKDFSSVLFNQDQLKRDSLYWHYPHYHRQGGPAGAIRKGDYKLIEYFDDGRLELYNLNEDLGEQVNLAAQQPEKVAELLHQLSVWRKSVGAQMMQANPKYDPQQAKF
ncbi:sulfatase [Aliiglaciecola lipolytica]|uniref:Predicted sulfatase n=1 Tax=Aliiglaciecola lipolytica E3 TaxID=1127673 RepID=K6XQ78_9ALTE|nr:sulfatase [Aliiglaciecola lipolytica]GAC13811.1 predicted sulfatase [Aliiglaciecola lipolytica E3]